MRRQKKRILSILLTLCMVCSTISMPVYAAEIEESPTQEAGETASNMEESQNDAITPTDATQVITEFITLAGEVQEQKLEIGAAESDINLPESLSVTLENGTESTVENITWKIDTENSDAETFDNSETNNGAYYTYLPELPDGYTLADGVALPEIWVLIGQEQRVAYANTNKYGTEIGSGYSTAGVKWTVYDSNGDNYGDTLVFSGNGEINTLAYSEDGWSGYTGTLTKLYIEDGITEIGQNAFNGQTYFKGDLTIPDSVTVIGNSAFKNCTGFDGTLTLGTSNSQLTTIIEYAFDGCSGFNGRLVVPDSVTVLDSYAFRKCSGFDGTLTLSKNLTKINAAVFNGCSNFTGNLIIPEGVTGIEAEAFKGMNHLDAVYIPSSVTTFRTDYPSFNNSSGTQCNMYFQSTTTKSFTGYNAIPGYSIKRQVGDTSTDITSVYADNQQSYTLIEADLSATAPAGYQLAGWTYTMGDGAPQTATAGSEITNISGDIVLQPVYAKSLSQSNITDVSFSGSAVYDGTTVSHPVTLTLQKINADGSEVSEETITTTATATFASADAGTYAAYTLSDIVLPEGSNYALGADTLNVADASEALQLTVSKAAITANQLSYTAPANLTADGSKKEATVLHAEGVTGLGEITVKYKKSEETSYLTSAPTEIGTYEVYASVAEGTNYLATATDIKVGEFAIHLDGVATVKVGTETTYYATLAQAIAEAQKNNGCTVTMIKNTTEDITVNGGTFTLDLGRNYNVTNTLKSTGTPLTITGGNITVQNGMIQSGNNKPAISITDGKLMLANTCKINYNNTDTDKAGLLIGGGEVVSEADNGNTIAEIKGTTTQTAGTLTVNGGRFWNVKLDPDMTTLNGGTFCDTITVPTGKTVVGLLGEGCGYYDTWNTGKFITDADVLNGTTITQDIQVKKFPVIIKTKPQNATVTYGNAATFTMAAATADGTGTISYSGNLYKIVNGSQEGKGSFSAKNCASGAEVTRSFENLEAGTYTLVITAKSSNDSNYEATFDPVTIIVNKATGKLTNKIEGGYATSYIYTGNAIAEPVDSNFDNNAGALSYEWYNGYPVETDTEKLTERPSALGAYTLRVIAAQGDNYDTVTLDLEVKIVEPPVNIITQPATNNPALDFGNTVTLEVKTDVTEGVSYKWADNGTDIDGAENATYTTVQNMAVGEHSFTCKVSMGDYSITTKPVVITVNYAAPKQVGGVYQIANASNLMWFAVHVNDTSNADNQKANAVLTVDIDMDGIVWPGMTSYAGTFDGAGFTIQNLNKGGSGEQQSAFIRNLETNGVVKCLNFDGATAWFHNLGRSNAIIAETNNGTIQNCLVLNSSVSCGNYGNLGGIAAVNNNKIENCGVVSTKLTRKYSAATARDTGGITEVNNGTVQNCYTYGVTFTNAKVAGGIVASGTLPTDSYFYTTITTTSSVDGTTKTKEEFGSGEVAYLLNGSKSTPAEGGNLAWYQNLSEGGDAYPVLDSTHGIVYKDGETYTNTDPSIITFDKLNTLISTVETKLKDGTYANTYTTASIANLRVALIAAQSIQSSDTSEKIKEAYDKLTVASTEGDNGLIKADKHIQGCFTTDQQNKGDIAGTGWYAIGDEVTLTATPRLGYVFSKWSNTSEGTAIDGAGATYQFAVTADTAVDYFVWFGDVPYTLTIKTATGGTASVTTGEKDGYSYGDSVTLTATADENYQFVNWQSENGVILSENAVYTLEVKGNTTVIPVFAEKAADKIYVTVTFYHQSGTVIGKQIVEKDAGKVTEPAAPVKNGYSFDGWTKEKGGTTPCELSDLTFAENTSLYPIFKADPEKNFSLTVKYQNLADKVTSHTPQTKVTVTAENPADGYKFAGWKTTDGTYVSYDMTYAFIIAGDTTLIPEYVLDQTIVEKKPSIYVNAPVYTTKEEGVSQRATMYFNYDIPEGYTLKDIGVIYAAGTKETLTLEDVDGTNTVMRSALSTITNSENAAANQFYYYKTVIKDATNYTLCGYIVVEGSKGREVFYTSLTDAVYQNN